jgi:hypothetical protein
MSVGRAGRHQSSVLFPMALAVAAATSTTMAPTSTPAKPQPGSTTNSYYDVDP